MSNLFFALLCSLHFSISEVGPGILVSPGPKQSAVVSDDDHYLPKDGDSSIGRAAKAMTIVRNRLTILQSQCLLKFSGLTIDGINHDYVKVRHTPFVIRYGKDGSYESVIFSLRSTLRQFLQQPTILQGNWKCESIVLNVRKGKIDQIQPFSYFAEVEDDVIIYKYGLINPMLHMVFQ